MFLFIVVSLGVFVEGSVIRLFFCYVAQQLSVIQNVIHCRMISLSDKLMQLTYVTFIVFTTRFFLWLSFVCFAVSQLFHLQRFMLEAICSV